jgi:hypothetical protein
MLVALMVGFSVFYYFVIYLPGLEKQKAEQAERAKIDAEVREAQVRLKYETCLVGAHKNYEANWAAACEGVARTIEENLRACLSDKQIMNNPYMGENYCRRIYKTIVSSPDCALPKSRADSINQKYKQEQDKCLTEAKSGL